MQFKLDENFGRSIQAIFKEHGHDCSTVYDEQLSGAVDEELLAAASTEGRVLVTMDHDFANVVHYPPDRTPGIVLLNPPGQASFSLLEALARELLAVLSSEQVRGKLWIVEPGRIREHGST